MADLPNGLVGFGPDANCTLATCPIEASVYRYRPSLAGNAFFAALFGIATIIHVYLGFRWKTWGFMSCVILGSACEIAGYINRILLYNNPFDFISFMIQFLLITVGPVFYTAAIYITLSKTMNHLAIDLARFNPKLLYWIFIPLDVVCLILQLVGGYLAEDLGQLGVDINIAGLVLQVVVIFFFCVAFADYITRYIQRFTMSAVTKSLQLFLSGLGVAIVLILLRSIYRAYELSKGFVDSDLMSDQGLFIGLEGVPIILAVFALCVGHPGLFLGRGYNRASSQASDIELKATAGSS